MSRYQFTPQALSDFFEILNFIAEGSPAAADRVEEAILQACEFLAGSPHAGRVRSDLTDLPVRFWTIQPYLNYLVIYDPEARPLQVLRILHGARDLPTLLT